MSVCVRRSVLVWLVSLCGLAGGLVFESAGALAALTYPFDGQLAPSEGSFGRLEPNSVAVSDANGDTYVAVSKTGVVDVFDSAGAQLAPLNSSLTPAGSFGGGEIAVAANNGTGRVYVLDRAHNVLDAFDSAGNYVCQITGSATPSASECNGVAGSATPAGGFNEPGGIAVDQATGSLYVVDANNGVVDVFSVGGAYLSQISLESIEGGFSPVYTRSVAVNDFNGHVYVSDSRGANSVYEFDAAGGYLTTWRGANTPAGSFGTGFISVAADDTTGYVYVTETAHGVTDVLDSSGSYATQFSHSYHNPLGTAVDEASGKVYISDNEPAVGETEPAVVDIFGPPPLVPFVKTGSASNVQPSSAVLEGAVNPRGIQLSDCHFDYGTDTSYGQTAPCVPAAASIPSDSNDHAVTADLTGLTPGTTYHFRLEASNANGTDDFAGDVTFATPPPPSIDSVSATNVTGASADLNARINPNGFDTTYHFEWGTSTAYGASVPAPDADLGAGGSAVALSQHISGLSANTTYHWRVLARNVNGTITTGDHTFIYDTSGGGLPAHRAYEMVTPPRKNGALIGGTGEESGGLFLDASVAEDGSRVILDNIQCFAGSGACTGYRELAGEPYAFTRTGGGWKTTPLAPPATRFGANTAWLANADRGTALFSVTTPPMNEEDFYAHQPDGSFLDLGPLTLPSRGAVGLQSVGPQSDVVATADLSHVVYNLESVYLWPFDATEHSFHSVYEYVGGGNAQPALVGVSGGSGSTDLISKCETYLGGHGGNDVDGALSADGSTVFFTARGGISKGVACSGSGANAGIPVPAETLYARIGGSRTVLISGRSPLDCSSAGGCSSSPQGDAEFEGASADGSKVFFTDTQQLTDSASEDSQSGDSASLQSGGSRCVGTAGVGGCNLYEYDFANPAGRNLLAVSAGDTSGGGPRVQGVTAISPDGSHVYFVARSALSAAANSRGQLARSGANNLYVFERDASHPAGRVSFIAALPASDSEGWVDGPISENNGNVTPDGRFLVFVSHGALTADDTSTTGVAQVFRYDAQSGELVRISIGEHGFNDNGNVGTGDASIVRPLHEYYVTSPQRSDPTMSHDGSYVFFRSPIGLTSGALDDVPAGRGGFLAQNVYEWHEGHVYLISDGRDTSTWQFFSSVRLIGSDATGANVFFGTADPLVSQDTDTGLDYYDARVCTASDPCVTTPAPSSPPCASETCHGTPAGPPLSLAPGSVTSSGAGNLAPAAKLVVKPKKKAKSKRRKPRHRKKKSHSAARSVNHTKQGRR